MYYRDIKIHEGFKLGECEVELLRIGENKARIGIRAPKEIEIQRIEKKKSDDEKMDKRD